MLGCGADEGSLMPIFTPRGTVSVSSLISFSSVDLVIFLLALLITFN